MAANPIQGESMNSSSRRTLSARGLVAAMLLVFSAGFASAQTPAAVPAAPAAASVAEVDLFADAPVADRVVIETVRELAKQGKWKSAWETLAGYDPENANPYILAQKIRVALDGYLQTTFHLMFGFEDLEEGDELLFKRMEAAEPENPVEFFPGDFAQAIEDKGEAVPPVLSLYLGEYFYTVFSSYQGQWLMPDQEVLARGATQFERAYAYDVYTPESLGQYSELLMALEQYEGAEKVLLKAMEFSPGDMGLAIRLSEVFLQTGRYEEVYGIADGIIAAAANDTELNDGYIAGIKAALYLGDKDKVEQYVAKMELSFPTDFMPGLVRHLAFVQLGDAEAAAAAADAVTEKFPGNPDVIRSIVSTWLSANDMAAGFAYLDRMIAKAASDDALAALYFYRALLGGEGADTGEKLGAVLADLATAESYFRKTYPEGHEVYGMIEQLKAQWTGAIEQLKTEAEMAAGGGDTDSQSEADSTSAASEEWETEEAAETPAATQAPAAPAPQTAAPAAPAQPAETPAESADEVSAASESY
jgi:hypothetical protein